MFKVEQIYRRKNTLRIMDNRLVSVRRGGRGERDG
jgi:hypothetical protein